MATRACRVPVQGTRSEAHKSTNQKRLDKVKTEMVRFASLGYGYGQLSAPFGGVQILARMSSPLDIAGERQPIASFEK